MHTHTQLTLDHICDIVESSIIKRRAEGYSYGTVVLAESLVTAMEPEYLERVSVCGAGMCVCVGVSVMVRIYICV